MPGKESPFGKAQLGKFRPVVGHNGSFFPKILDARPTAPILTATVWPSGLKAMTPIEPPKRRRVFWGTGTTARHGDALVDLYARWQQVADHPEYLSADGFHPSSEGYQALADVFGDALRDAGP